MPKNIDCQLCTEAKQIMEALLMRFGDVFEGCDPSMVDFWVTLKEKAKVPVKVHSVPYPYSIYIPKPFIIEIFSAFWDKMDKKRKNMTVFRAMCAMSPGGFDESSKEWAKVRKPDIQMFMEEYAVCGGLPDWIENEESRDPMVVGEDDTDEKKPEIARVPVDKKEIENIDMMDLVDKESLVKVAV